MPLFIPAAFRGYSSGFQIMKIKKIIDIRPKQLIDSLANFVTLAAEYAFITSLVFLTISLIIGSSVYYKYSILPEKTEVPVEEVPLQFDEQNYKAVAKQWEDREKRFNEADKKEYTNPFWGQPKTTP